MKIRNSVLLFGTMNVPRLFVKLFIPTLMGLIFSAILNLADGIFVGKGVGSDALASVNVAAPIFLVSTGIALLFATGVSIVAAVHLSLWRYGAIGALRGDLSQRGESSPGAYGVDDGGYVCYPSRWLAEICDDVQCALLVVEYRSRLVFRLSAPHGYLRCCHRYEYLRGGGCGGYLVLYGIPLSKRALVQAEVHFYQIGRAHV